MSSQTRRAAARRRAWGRGPMILRFEPLEERALLTGGIRALPDLVMASFVTNSTTLDWGDPVEVVGTILNQGGGTTGSDFKVDLFASASPTAGPAALFLGSIDIPAGLTPGATAHFDQTFTLPGSPIFGTDPNNPALFLDLRLNHDRTVPESNFRNDQNQGENLDTVLINIAPHTPANLMGTALGVNPDTVTWGQPLTVTTQIMNNGQGDAPVTRARFVLTPAALIPGGPSDVTIDSMSVPAIPAFQTTNIVHTITLPPVPPPSLATSTQFILTMVPDADFQTNNSVAAQVAQGLGVDQAMLTIDPGVIPYNSKALLPDLSSTGVIVPTQPVAWGTTISAGTLVQNLGLADAGPFRVRFLLAGQNGTAANGIFLGDAILPGLKAGFSQAVAQTLRLPSRLPGGYLINGTAVARILVQIDPENTVGESLETNNVVSSGPLRLFLPGTDGTTNVPTNTTPTTVGTAGYGTPTGRTPAPGTPVRRLPTRLNSKPHGLKLVGQRVENFFKDLGKKLSITGGSHTA